MSVVLDCIQANDDGLDVGIERVVNELECNPCKEVPNAQVVIFVFLSTSEAALTDGPFIAQKHVSQYDSQHCSPQPKIPIMCDPAFLEFDCALTYLIVDVNSVSAIKIFRDKFRMWNFFTTIPFLFLN